MKKRNVFKSRPKKIDVAFTIFGLVVIAVLSWTTLPDSSAVHWAIRFGVNVVWALPALFIGLFSLGNPDKKEEKA